MKETPVSLCERTFLLEALSENKRLDGRGLLETRDLNISFGTDWGSCQVTLGRTRVIAQVSAQLTEPRLARPNEGILLVNVELSPIAAPKFEIGRLSDEGVEINRLLERCLKESRCLDLESLCVISEEKVWTVRLDLHVLNHEGNLADACSVAGLAALCHFRRPDVTLSGDQVTVHPINERDPVPLSVHHHPVTNTFAMFPSPAGAATKSNSQHRTVCDPTRIEEECMQGKLVLGVNAYKEICTLHLAGQVIVDKSIILRLANIAADKSRKVVEQIKSCLAKEEELRRSGVPRGFAAAIRNQSIVVHRDPGSQLDFSNIAKEARDIIQDTKEVEPMAVQVVDTGDGVVEILPENMEAEDNDDSDVEVVDEKSAEVVQAEKIKEKIELLDDSEEEETVTLSGGLT